MEDQTAEEKGAAAQFQLEALGFDEDAVRRALGALKPRNSHKTQIEKICEQLGLGSDGDVASMWKSLIDNVGNAHGRSFHRSLDVDESFRAQYQIPFDTVIRSVAIALQGRYLSLLGRVEHLATMQDCAQAVKLFAREIPGALPLQRHFYQRLLTSDWIPHLNHQGLLREPVWDVDDKENNARFQDWPVGDYLVRMAASDDMATRQRVIASVRGFTSSEHPAVQQCGLSILAALPARESGALAHLAVAWLNRGGDFLFQEAAEKYLGNLAASGQKQAILLVARALLQVRKEGHTVSSIYAHDLYANRLPATAKLLASACGTEGLDLLIGLLRQAGNTSDQSEFGLYFQHPISDDENTEADIFPALLAAVRRTYSARSLVLLDNGSFATKLTTCGCLASFGKC